MGPDIRLENDMRRTRNLRRPISLLAAVLMFLPFVAIAVKLRPRRLLLAVWRRSTAATSRAKHFRLSTASNWRETFAMMVDPLGMAKVLGVLIDAPGEVTLVVQSKPGRRRLTFRFDPEEAGRCNTRRERTPPRTRADTGRSGWNAA